MRLLICFLQYGTQLSPSLPDRAPANAMYRVGYGIQSISPFGMMYILQKTLQVLFTGSSVEKKTERKIWLTVLNCVMQKN